MNVLFIDPPVDMDAVFGDNKGFKNVQNSIPSLGLSYLAAVALAKGHNTRIAECIFGNWKQVLEQKLKNFKPDFVAMSALTPTFGAALETSRTLKQRYPDAFFCLGGSHPTALPEQTLEQSNGVFDVLALAEGERTLEELLDFAASGKTGSLEDIKGIAFVKDGKPFLTPKRAFIEDLDSLPFPARELNLPLEKHNPTPASYRRLPVGIIMTSRGCPAQCTFCDKAVFGAKTRFRSVANVMREVDEVVNRFGAREIRFFDDTFTLNRQRVIELCREMKKFRPQTGWTCLTRVNCVDPELLAIMKDSGCWQVLFGLESGDDEMLKRLKKGTTVAQNRKAVMWAAKAGLRIRGDFIVGTPGETAQSLAKTLEFAKSLPLDFAHFNKFVPLPGTAIYEELKQRGAEFVFDAGSFINNHSSTMYVPETLDEKQYLDFLNSSYRAFYLRPRYALHRLMGIRTVPELLGQLKGLCSVLSF